LEEVKMAHARLDVLMRTWLARLTLDRDRNLAELARSALSLHDLLTSGRDIAARNETTAEYVVATESLMSRAARPRFSGTGSPPGSGAARGGYPVTD
jgi:hypothetical protein